MAHMSLLVETTTLTHFDENKSSDLRKCRSLLLDSASRADDGETANKRIPVRLLLGVSSRRENALKKLLESRYRVEVLDIAEVMHLRLGWTLRLCNLPGAPR